MNTTRSEAPYTIFPAVREMRPGEGAFTLDGTVEITTSRTSIGYRVASAIREHARVDVPVITIEDDNPWLHIGAPGADRRTLSAPEHAQGYRLEVAPRALVITAADETGLFYGSCTLEQILDAPDRGGANRGGAARGAAVELPGASILDYPALPWRGVMVDCSRGRVYSLEYLKTLAVTLSRMKMNVLQLYIEHTFAFPSCPEIWEGSDPLTPEEIRNLDRWCRDHHVELQPNLQSFGHCNRILTTQRFRELRESDLYWTLSPAEEGTYALLDRMYEDFLPAFSSSLFNVGSDETYDLGTGKTAEVAAREGKGRVYLGHLLRLHELAAARGKRIMVFGDVILKYPDLIGDIPGDIVFLDWMYDPREEYGTPEVFARHGKRFWVCPGTGAWNTLFPRQEGAVHNVLGFTLEGLRNGAEGMLLTDWGDHGSYGMPAATSYIYGIGAAVSWHGEGTTREIAEQGLAAVLGEDENYLQVHRRLEKIHRLPALWSKNRSQCVMAFFDEPLTGLSVTGPVPPLELAPMKPLPEGTSPVMDQEGHHPMRPVFRITGEVLQEMEEILRETDQPVCSIRNEQWRDQYRYVIGTYRLAARKVALGREIREQFASGRVTVEDLLDWDRDLRLLIRDYVTVQMDFARLWHTFARTSEISISMTWYAHVIERLDYLRSWLTQQRRNLEHRIQPDYSLTTYQTAGYRTLPTY